MISSMLYSDRGKFMRERERASCSGRRGVCLCVCVREEGGHAVG